MKVLLARLRRRLSLLAAFAFVAAGMPAVAQTQQAAEADPPGRVAHVTHRQGSVVFAPDGEQEWVELPANRPLTTGDRLWNDRGARAELHIGSATLHLDGESHLGFSALDDLAAHFILQQGSLNARVRELAQGENFEVDTPNLAFRALQPGDYRIDVEAGGKETRIVVMSGTAVVFGEGGSSLNLGAGQHVTFAGRALAPVQQPAWQADDFGQWAAERNRLEDASVTARHVPRNVIGYQQLDQHGTWSSDPTHGTIWYPNVTVQDWAPYRHGRWTWIQPWGWTWVDDAPWGFAPFHYGRWTQVGSRWGWVPGPLAARPAYSPALVVFMGGGGTSVNLAVGSGPGVGWYPLAPGEVWWPWYRTSPRYVSWANHRYDLHRHPRDRHDHYWRQRPHAATVVRVEDFRTGRPVRHAWTGGQGFVSQGRMGWVPGRPERRWEREQGPARLQSAPAATPAWRGWSGRDGDRREWQGQRRDWQGPREGQGQRRDWQGPRDGQGQRREAQGDRRDGQGERRDGQGERRDRWDGQRRSDHVQPAPQAPAAALQGDGDRALREQRRAQWEQERLQRDAERQARRQQREQQQQQRQQLQQPPAQPMVRPQYEWQGREQERQQREAQRAAREQERQQREAQWAAREQERQQREAQRAAREQQRQQMHDQRNAAQPVGRAGIYEQQRQQREQRQHVQPAPQIQSAPAQPAARAEQGQHRGRGDGEHRGRREDRERQGEGRGQGRGG